MLIAFWILVVVAIAVIIISFIMAPDSNSFSGALVGSTDLDLFKQSRERGSKKALKWSMMWLGIMLIVIAVVVRALT